MGNINKPLKFNSPRLIPASGKMESIWGISYAHLTNIPPHGVISISLKPASANIYFNPYEVYLK